MSEDFYAPRVAAQDLLKEQRGTLGHVLVEFAEVKLGGLDSGLYLRWVVLCEWQPSAQPDH